MDTHLSAIFNDSRRIISKLQLLAVFFEDEIIYKIYLRTQVIHQLFENNQELNAHQLELFHVQFTESLLALLKKIKKSNEQNVHLLLDEIQLNNEMIDKLSSVFDAEKNYQSDQQNQSHKISISLRKLYQVLSGYANGYPFSQNINAFSSKFSKDFYAEVSPELWQELMQYNPAEVYTNVDAIIQKKLLGQLCKYDFKVSFFCGIKAGNTLAEVYKLAETERYFLFCPAKNGFVFCDPAKFDRINFETAVSNQEKMIRELNDKNDHLQSRINMVKTHLPKEVKALLSDHYRKLNELDFLNNTENFDTQANILKKMLGTDMI